MTGDRPRNVDPARPHPGAHAADAARHGGDALQGDDALADALAAELEQAAARAGRLGAFAPPAARRATHRPLPAPGSAADAPADGEADAADAGRSQEPRQAEPAGGVPSGAAPAAVDAHPERLAVAAQPEAAAVEAVPTEGAATEGAATEEDLPARSEPSVAQRAGVARPTEPIVLAADQFRDWEQSLRAIGRDLPTAAAPLSAAAVRVPVSEPEPEPDLELELEREPEPGAPEHGAPAPRGTEPQAPNRQGPDARASGAPAAPSIASERVDVGPATAPIPVVRGLPPLPESVLRTGTLPPVSEPVAGAPAVVEPPRRPPVVEPAPIGTGPSSAEPIGAGPTGTEPISTEPISAAAIGAEPSLGEDDAEEHAPGVDAGPSALPPEQPLVHPEPAGGAPGSVRIGLAVGWAAALGGSFGVAIALAQAGPALRPVPATVAVLAGVVIALPAVRHRLSSAALPSGLSNADAAVFGARAARAIGAVLVLARIGVAALLLVALSDVAVLVAARVPGLGTATVPLAVATPVLAVLTAAVIAGVRTRAAAVAAILSAVAGVAVLGGVLGALIRLVPARSDVPVGDVRATLSAGIAALLLFGLVTALTGPALVAHRAGGVRSRDGRGRDGRSRGRSGGARGAGVVLVAVVVGAAASAGVLAAALSSAVALAGDPVARLAGSIAESAPPAVIVAALVAAGIAAGGLLAPLARSALPTDAPAGGRAGSRRGAALVLLAGALVPAAAIAASLDAADLWVRFTPFVLVPATAWLGAVSVAPVRGAATPPASGASGARAAAAWILLLGSILALALTDGLAVPGASSALLDALRLPAGAVARTPLLLPVAVALAAGILAGLVTRIRQRNTGSGTATQRTGRRTATQRSGRRSASQPGEGAHDSEARSAAIGDAGRVNG